MAIIDSKGGSTATGLIALQAVSWIKDYNLDYQQIVSKITELVNSVEHIFTLSDLSWLIKGGRIGSGTGDVREYP